MPYRQGVKQSELRRFACMALVCSIAIVPCLAVGQAAITEIRSPEPNSEFTQGVAIAVKARAFDPDGIGVARLWVNDAFYALAHPGNDQVFRDRFAPTQAPEASPQTAEFVFQLTGLASGQYRLMVRSRDSLGNALDSDTVGITVVAPPPTQTIITSPANNSRLTQGDALLVEAQATDPVGVDAVRLWINDTYHSVDSEPPYQFQVAALPVGSHRLMVRSRNTQGVALDSQEVNVIVAPDTVDESAIRLPIEVLGPAGTLETVDFELADASGVSHLYLLCNACGYDDIALNTSPSLSKATVRVNGGPAIALQHFIDGNRVYGNPDIVITDAAAGYGGIGGGFRTVGFKVPVSGLRDGANTLTFEHLDAVPPSIGYRIIAFNLLRQGDLANKVLPASAFVDDAPVDWAAPLSGFEAIDAGRNLWQATDVLYDPWVDALDGQVNGEGPLDGNIKASCAGCHATSGRDLKYFNFSNRSIVERSLFHGLSQREGEQIASYIRSLPMPIVEQARPWNPAYQPGPGLDAKDVYEWAAGAGMQAVLSEDAEIAPYLFPNGTSLQDVRAAVDRYETLNFRQLPIAMPLPEWNQWLPIIHPDDAFDLNVAAISADEDGDPVGQPFYEHLYQQASQDPTPSKVGALAYRLKRWLRREQTCSTAGLTAGEPMRGLNGAVLDALALPFERVTTANCLSVVDGDRQGLEFLEIAKRGLTAWSSVKMWDIIHRNDLEEAAQQMTQPACSDGRCVDASEARGWVADGRNVFDRPPHFTATGGGRRYFSQNEMLGVFESSAWYHLNMILNPGYRQTMPSHFAYAYTHVELLQRYSGVAQGYRFWATMIKQRQLQTNGRYGVEAGLDLRTSQPYVYFGTARRTTSTDTQASVGQPLWGRLAQAMLEDFVADADNATAQNWADANQNRRVQPRNSTDFSGCGSPCSFDLGPYQGRNTYRVIPELRNIGVAEGVIQDLIDWAEKTWPNGPWDDLR